MLDVSSVTAIIVTYKSAAVIEFCVRTLCDQGISVIVVDNNSHDGSAELAAMAGARIILSPTNLGFGVANNLGVAHAATPWLLFINPDACLERGAVSNLLQAPGRYPDAGLFGPRIVEPDGRVFFQTKSLLATQLKNPKGILHLPDGDCCVPFVSGACMFLRKDLFQELGGFDPNIFLFYEDDDLCRRITDKGKAIIWLNNVDVRHVRGSSSATCNRLKFLVRANLAWSRGYVCRKYGIKNNMFAKLFMNVIKFLATALALRLGRMARYGGTCIGLWRSMRNQTRPT